MFIYFIRFLKDYFMEEIKKSIVGVISFDVEFVLIVLVIWGDKVKMFMREVVIVV